MVADIEGLSRELLVLRIVALGRPSVSEEGVALRVVLGVVALDLEMEAGRTHCIVACMPSTFSLVGEAAPSIVVLLGLPPKTVMFVLTGCFPVFNVPGDVEPLCPCGVVEPAVPVVRGPWEVDNVELEFPCGRCVALGMLLRTVV